MPGISLEQLAWTGRSCTSRMREASQGLMETRKRISSELGKRSQDTEGGKGGKCRVMRG